jgi:hypothetical protein
MRRARRAENLRRIRRAVPPSEVIVDELFLDGFPPRDRHAIGDAFALELERALAEFGPRRVFRQDANLPSLDAGRFSMRSSAGSASVGTQAARAVLGALRSGGVSMGLEQRTTARPESCRTSKAAP